MKSLTDGTIVQHTLVLKNSFNKIPGVFTSSGIFLPFYEIRLLHFCCHPGRFLYGVCCCLPSSPKILRPVWFGTLLLRAKTAKDGFPNPAGGHSFGDDDQQENASQFNNNF